MIYSTILIILFISIGFFLYAQITHYRKLYFRELKANQELETRINKLKYFVSGYTGGKL